MKIEKITESLNLAAKVERSSNLLNSFIDDEAIILSIEHSRYYAMNPVGSRIWSLLESPRSVVSIINALLAEFDAPPKEIEKDVIDFLLQLVNEKLICVVCDDGRDI